MSIAENIARIREQMKAAAIAAGRDPESIILCAATKINSADAVRQAKHLWCNGTEDSEFAVAHLCDTVCEEVQFVDGR